MFFSFPEYVCIFQDASRLMDLCRQSIVFDSLSCLASCLRVITNDPDTAVVRVKNRFDPSYKSAISGGYRDVVLNLRIFNSRTAALGVDCHICELQLLHRQFAELKVLFHSHAFSHLL